jgi:hypothetical protein
VHKTTGHATEITFALQNTAGFKYLLYILGEKPGEPMAHYLLRVRVEN